MKYFVCILIGLGMSPGAHAEIYKHVDAEGHVTYSNVPMKGAVRLDLGPAAPPGAAPAKAKAATPADFPRVEKEVQRQRDDKRRQILEQELASERKALDEARQNLAAGEATPEVYRGKDGKTYRNVAKYEAKIQQLQEDVATHQRNVELLEKELRTLRQ